MKDLHCHALYGVDDGCETLSESIELLRKMSKNGVTDVVLTPHYIDNSDYSCDNKKKRNLFNKLKKKLLSENIDINIYLGNEVMFCHDIMRLINEKLIYPINDGKYILFEFPMHSSYTGTGEVISALLKEGYTPILAHPERYRQFLKYPDLAEEYLRMGVLLQCNISSLYGKYGRKSKKLFKYYIKNGWVSFLGSDSHHSFKYKAKRIKKKLRKINKDEDYLDDLLNNNFDKVINSQDLGMIR